MHEDRTGTERKDKRRHTHTKAGRQDHKHTHTNTRKDTQGRARTPAHRNPGTLPALKARRI